MAYWLAAPPKPATTFTDDAPTSGGATCPEALSVPVSTGVRALASAITFYISSTEAAARAVTARGPAAASLRRSSAVPVIRLVAIAVCLERASGQAKAD